MNEWNSHLNFLAALEWFIRPLFLNIISVLDFVSVRVELQKTETTTVFSAEGNLNSLKIVGRSGGAHFCAFRSDSHITADMTHEESCYPTSGRWRISNVSQEPLISGTYCLSRDPEISKPSQLNLLLQLHKQNMDSQTFVPCPSWS